MARASLADRLADMLETIEHVERQAAGKSLADYQGDRVLRDVVEQSVERLSEASRHIPEDLKQSAPHIPWADVASIGNVLRHGYFGIDDEQVWSVVVDDFADLKAAIRSFLAQSSR